MHVEFWSRRSMSLHGMRMIRGPDPLCMAKTSDKMSTSQEDPCAQEHNDLYDWPLKGQWSLLVSTGHGIQHSHAGHRVMQRYQMQCTLFSRGKLAMCSSTWAWIEPEVLDVLLTYSPSALCVQRGGQRKYWSGEWCNCLYNCRLQRSSSCCVFEAVVDCFLTWSLRKHHSPPNTMSRWCLANVADKTYVGPMPDKCIPCISLGLAGRQLVSPNARA